MGYVYEYDFAAVLIVLAVLLNFLRKVTLNTAITKLFTVLISMIGFASALDIITSYIIEHPALFPMWFNYILLVLFYASYFGVPFFFYIFVLFATGLNKRKNLLQIFNIIPYILGTLFILVSPFLKTVFYFDSDLNYYHGILYIALYVFCAFYLFYTLYIAHKFGSSFSLSQKRAVYAFTLFCVGAIIIQFIFDKVMIVCLCSSISGVFIYLSLENPGNYLDKEMNLFNKLALSTYIQQISKSKKSYSIVALQIMGIHYISNILGNSFKTQLFNQISELLKATCKKQVIFRISSNRFVILINNPNKSEEIIKRLQLAFEEPLRISDSTIPLSTRITYFNFPEDVNNPENTMDLIEYSLNELEETGTAFIKKADVQILQRKRRETYLIDALKKASKTDGFQIYLEPVYSLKENRFVGAETKIHFKNPELKSIQAKEFIPLAEKNGLILNIENFILDEICSFIKKTNIIDKGIEKFFVNVSIIQCLQDQMTFNIIDKINTENIPSGTITLMLNNYSAFNPNNKLHKNMEKLVSNNINFILENYGDSDSNNEGLIKYPFQTVQLTKSLLKNALSDECSKTILHHTINMIKELKMDVFIDGVETEEQVALLRDLDCDFVKGTYFSAPLSENDFISFIGGNK